MDYRNLGIRTITGAILVAVLVTATLPILDATGYIFLAVFSVITIFAMREFMKINGAGNLESFQAAICSLVLFLWRWAKFNTQMTNRLLSLYAVLLLLMVIGQLLKDHTNMVERAKRLLTGQCYIAIPFAFMNDLRFCSAGVLLFSVFVLIWVNDTFAFLTGSMLGKHKMIERVSPKKTWEGFYGGMLFVLGGAALLWHFFGGYELWQWIVIGVVVSIFGTFGDLIESQMKRTLGIKDSGKAIPGHGGWLDRFDSVIIASIALNVLRVVL